MKKQIVTACALIASVAAFATSVESSNTFGVLKIAAPAGQSIIPVPWEKVGGGDIAVTDYVLPTGLSTGDMLYWYDNGEANYKVWKIENGAWTNVGANKIESTGVTPIESALTQTFSRGSAAILNLASTATVYLSGQYSSEDVAVKIYGPTAEDAAKLSRVSTLIAPSKASDVTIDESMFYKDEACTQPVAETDLVGDSILLPDGNSYKYSKTFGGWYLEGGSTPTKTDVLIPVGQGAWYSRGNAGNIYIEW
ncbi:MAG: hypothetical protein IJ173_09660 [Kiritimatiellae bacterium]|nr:hypothetical protein [Kiritimatiellia bacterium]